MRNVEVARLLARTACLLYSGTLIGDPPPAILARRERMCRLHVGDLVVELTTARHDPFDQGRIGYLEDVRVEPVSTEAEWLANENELPVGTDTYWYIRRLVDGKVARWYNAAFVAIPEYPEDEWLSKAGPSWRGGF